MAEAVPGELHARLAQPGPIPLDAELRCRPGELLALVGPSGSGKTTLLRAIAGLEPVAQAEVRCAGELWQDSTRGLSLSPQRRRVGLVFQDYALFPHMSALDNVSAALGHLARAKREERARALLELVHLKGLEARRPGALSGGQRQRVAVARALAREPKVLLLDEPFSAVDRATRSRLQNELALVRRALSVPIVLVTHDLDEALALADRLVVLHRGRTLQGGAPMEVIDRPASALVARLLGHTNLFPGRVLQAAAPHGPPGRLAWAGGELEVAVTGRFQVDEAVTWLVPPSRVVLHRRGRPSLGEHENPVHGEVAQLVPLGENTTVRLHIDGAGPAPLSFTVSTHAARRNGLEAGAQASASLLAEGIHLMPADTAHGD